MITDAATFEQLPAAVQGLGKRRLTRLSREGKAPPYVRLSGGYSAQLWSRAAIAEWLAIRLAPLTPAAASPPPLTEYFDGEPTP